ncbi:MAG: PHP domain-containing protein [Candidatus Zixiibacteriota bacterium]
MTASFEAGDAGWRGALHVHTELSHDGTMSLTEVSRLLRNNGYQFVMTSDHSQDVNDESMAQLVEQSDRLSTQDFLIIPGIEFTCDHWIHILGYGVTMVCASQKPADVINHIHRHGGLAVLAHPTIRPYPFDRDWIAMLDGCEIWNVANEGKYIPQTKSIRWHREHRRLNDSFKGFAGLDLHREINFDRVVTLVDAPALSRAALIDALRDGRYRTQSAWFEAPSTVDLPPLRRASLATARCILNIVRKARDRAQAWTSRTGSSR